eukprot:Lithocolla_globosa_v1_NODE_280_length_4679_cov_22.565528.p4 type:complete len:107 gc:universal NODE_280_length_4679_cov_22.565528:1588-1908(+)
MMMIIMTSHVSITRVVSINLVMIKMPTQLWMFAKPMVNAKAPSVGSTILVLFYPSASFHLVMIMTQQHRMIFVILTIIVWANHVQIVLLLSLIVLVCHVTITMMIQ